MSLARPLCCAGLLALAGPACRAPGNAPDAPPDRRITYYQSVLRGHPERYPARIGLGEACLEKARATHDPRWVIRARSEAQASLRWQPTYEGLLLLARVQNFAHRFESALSYGRRAADAAPGPQPDPAAAAVLVEAHLGLHDGAAAAALIRDLAKGPDSFPAAAARGAWLQSRRKWDEAAAAFLKAAALAREQQQTALADWAEVSAAGCHLDAGDAATALPRLEAVAARNPRDRFLRLHWAEYFRLTGDPRRALRYCNALLRETGDPSIHHLAFSIARESGDQKDSARHYAAAESGYLRVLAAGEIYSQEALAALRAEAGGTPGG